MQHVLKIKKMFKMALSKVVVFKLWKNFKIFDRKQFWYSSIFKQTVISKCLVFYKLVKEYIFP